MGRFLNCDKPPQFVVYLKEHRDEIMNRFTMKTDENGTPRLYDNETQCSYPIDDSPDNVEILINRLNDLDTFRMGYFGLEKTVKQLKDENHRLRLTMCHLNDLNIDIEWLKEHFRRMGKMSKYDDGRCCSICGNLKTIYHEWDCKGTWTSECECEAGHDLDETDGTDCDDYWMRRI